MGWVALEELGQKNSLEQRRSPIKYHKKIKAIMMRSMYCNPLEIKRQFFGSGMKKFTKYFLTHGY